MKARRPAERKRAARGLGARGETPVKANPAGRMPGAPHGSFEFEGYAGRLVESGSPRPPRGAQARRRTVRDNPRAGRKRR